MLSGSETSLGCPNTLGEIPRSELATGRIRPIGGPDWHCLRGSG